MEEFIASPHHPKNLFLTFPCDFPVVATYGNTAYHLSKDFVRVKMVAVIAGKTHIFVGAFFDYCFVQEF